MRRGRRPKGTPGPQPEDIITAIVEGTTVSWPGPATVVPTEAAVAARFGYGTARAFRRAFAPLTWYDLLMAAWRSFPTIHGSSHRDSEGKPVLEAAPGTAAAALHAELVRVGHRHEAHLPPIAEGPTPMIDMVHRRAAILEAAFRVGRQMGQVQPRKMSPSTLARGR